MGSISAYGKKHNMGDLCAVAEALSTGMHHDIVIWKDTRSALKSRTDSCEFTQEAIFQQNFC